MKQNLEFIAQLNIIAIVSKAIRIIDKCYKDECEQRNLAKDSQISTALSYYATDCTVPNSSNQIIWATSEDKKVAELINKLFLRWNINAVKGKGNEEKTTVHSPCGIKTFHYLSSYFFRMKTNFTVADTLCTYCSKGRNHAI